MSLLITYTKNYFLLVLLFFYGLFYHISSSEFWPITISKTWYDFNNFEYSLLQKPLFGLFLSIFHLLPLNDVQHLYTTKAVFTFFGVLCLWYFAEIIKKLTNLNSSSIAKNNFIYLILLILSPIYLMNFFNIRTDQVSLLLGLIFLNHYHQRNFKISILLLLALSLISVKSSLFFLILSPFIFDLFKQNIRTAKQLFFLALSLLAIIVWIVAFNFKAIEYFASSYSNENYSNFFLVSYLKSEFFAYTLSIIISIYFLFKRKYTPYSISCLLAAVIVLIAPQSYPFLISSFVPIIYLPLFLFILTKLSDKKILLSTVVISLLSIWINIQFFINYRSNFDQFKFIKSASHLVNKYQLTYADGMGILPRQSFLPCFSSPGDEDSNTTCLDILRTNRSQVVIVTQRFLTIGFHEFSNLNAYYTQVLPNFWIKNENFKVLPKEAINLNTIPVPAFIFNY